MTQLFTDTKKELEVTSGHLTITTGNLGKATELLTRVKTTLRQTEKDRDENAHLLSVHIDTETQLFGQASQVLGSTIMMYR
jgi:outer membrane PBP1 activator LpoA protein